MLLQVALRRPFPEVVRFMVGWNDVFLLHSQNNLKHRWRQRGCDSNAHFHRQVCGSPFPCQVYSVNNSDSPENVPAFLDAVKRREKVLSGFGHR
jgi:hypothetical protein